MSQTITKTYENLKAAHRQWRHPGHCHFVHGENWTLHLTFKAERLDEQNFVVDFGGLRPLRDKLEHLFDHTLLIDQDDPQRTVFEEMHKQQLADVRFLPSASAEGLCRYVFELADQFVRELTSNRVWVEQVVVEEDAKNTATLSKS